jgi:hypothetical protein
MSATDVLAQAIVPLISAASGLCGVALGGIIALRSQKRERRQRFICEQLSEFYAPMLGCRERLKARGELRLKIHTVAGSEWARLAEQTREIGMDALRELEEKRWPEFQRIIEYDNKQLEESDIPVYRQMLDLFTAKMHFAEPSTRAHLPALVEFIGLWERFLTGNLPHEVATLIGADEENLKRLYADLNDNFARLQTALKE